MGMKVIKIWSEHRGCWVDVAFASGYDRAFDKAKEVEAQSGNDARVMVEDLRNGNNEWINR